MPLLKREAAPSGDDAVEGLSAHLCELLCRLLVDGPVDKETAEELTQVSGETFYCVITRGSSFSFEKWHLGLLPGGGSYSEGYARYPRVFPEEFVGEHPYALLIMEDAVLRVVRLLPQEIKSMRPLTLLAKPEVLELLRLRRDNRVPYGELQRVANGHLQPGQPGLPNDPTDVGFLSPEDLQSARVVQAMAAARELLHIDDVQQPPDQGTRGGRIAWRIVKILLLILCGLALLGFVLLALHVQQAP